MEQQKLSPELIKAIQEGFNLPFKLIDGLFSCDLIPNKIYAAFDVFKEVRPCTVSETTVYKLNMPDGIKGYLIIKWAEQHDN